MPDLPAGVEVPAPIASPLKSTLLSVATRVSPEGDHADQWQLGGYFLPESCQSALLQANKCEPDGIDKLLEDCGPCKEDVQEIATFTVYQPIAGPTTAWRRANLVAEAERLLANTAPRSVEYGFWSGEQLDGVDLGETKELTDPAAFAINGGAAQTAFYGLRDLVQYASQNGNGRATIHASPAVVMTWHQQGMLLWENQRWTTAIGGHYVVPGTGYTGFGPGNVDPADPLLQWAYVTGPIYWSASQIYMIGDGTEFEGQEEFISSFEIASDADAALTSSVDHRQNRFNHLAEQVYLVWRDPCVHAGVLINLQTGAA